MNVLPVFCSNSVSVIWINYSKVHSVFWNISQLISWGFSGYWWWCISFRMQRLTFWRQCRTCWDIAQTLQVFSNLWQSCFPSSRTNCLDRSCAWYFRYCIFTHLSVLFLQIKNKINVFIFVVRDLKKLLNLWCIKLKWTKSIVCGRHQCAAWRHKTCLQPAWCEHLLGSAVEEKPNKAHCIHNEAFLYAIRVAYSRL